eukprot:9498692-Pyramimonas_sp.AAC.1
MAPVRLPLAAEMIRFFLLLKGSEKPPAALNRGFLPGPAASRLARPKPRAQGAWLPASAAGNGCVREER